MNRIIVKQILTSIILIILIAGTIFAGFYLREHSPIRVAERAASITPTPAPTATPEPTIAPNSRYVDRTTRQAATAISVVTDAAEGNAFIAFYGIQNTRTLEVLAADLNSTIVGQCFVTEHEIRTYADALHSLVQKGMPLGLRFDNTAFMTEDELIAQIKASTVAMQSSIGCKPAGILVTGPVSRDYLIAAYECGYPTVYSAQRTFSMDDTDGLKKRLELCQVGEVIGVSLSSSAKSVQECIILLQQGTGNAAAVKAERDARITENAGKKAEIVKQITTSEAAVGFAFTSLKYSSEFEYLLETLKELDGHAMFFATDDELENDSLSIKTALAEGHDVGYVLAGSEVNNVEDWIGIIENAQAKLKNSYGVDNDLYILLTDNKANDNLAEAASITNTKLVGYLYTAAKIPATHAESGEELANYVVPENKPMLQRGTIVYFKLGLFQEKNLMGDLVKAMVKTKTHYAIGSVAAMLNNKECMYQYPLDPDSILPEVKDQIFAGKMDGKVTDGYIAKRYIGIWWVDSKEFLPGFTYGEIQKLDKSGMPRNSPENTVYLTFDDWGTDNCLNELLVVLKKHNVKATFFVRTEHVVNNPNLLRAIAMDGHAIASHTNEHLQLSKMVDTAGKEYESLTQDELDYLQNDIVKSYQILQSVVGDVKVDGVPALTTYFRPPTLAVSKEALKVVFDCGYTYSVSGVETMQDYNATSAKLLAQKLERKTNGSTLFVMHMTDTAKYTAEAVDIYLTKMEKEGKYHFETLTSVLH